MLHDGRVFYWIDVDTHLLAEIDRRLHYVFTLMGVISCCMLMYGIRFVAYHSRVTQLNLSSGGTTIRGSLYDTFRNNILIKQLFSVFAEVYDWYLNASPVQRLHCVLQYT